MIQTYSQSVLFKRLLFGIGWVSCSGASLAFAAPGGEEPIPPQRQVAAEVVERPLSDQALLEFVRQRREQNRITRTMVFMDFWLATLCGPPRGVQLDEKSPHRQHAIHIYTNEAAFAPMWDPYESFPEGSVIIKEKFPAFKPDHPELFTGMLKREAGYAPEIGDWEFFVVDAAAKQVTDRGKLDSCIACHQQYTESDFVTKDYAARANAPFSAGRPLTQWNSGTWEYVDKPIVWSGRDTLILPAAWAITIGPKLTRSEATTLWEEAQRQKLSAQLDLSPPEDLAPWGGPKMRFEPSRQKNTLGYWTETGDSALWWFEIAQQGKYELQVYQGCGAGQGGSQVEFKVGDQTLPFTVEDTGHFQNFVWKTVGLVDLTPGKTHTLTVTPQQKAANAIMDIRQVRLVRQPE